MSGPYVCEVCHSEPDKNPDRATRSDPGRRTHNHHIFPLGRGGENQAENLVRLCQPCHRLAHLLGCPGASGPLARRRQLCIAQLRDHLQLDMFGYRKPTQPISAPVGPTASPAERKLAIQRALKLAPFSLPELAEDAGLSVHTLRAYVTEKRQPSSEAKQRIAEAFAERGKAIIMLAGELARAAGEE